MLDWIRREPVAFSDFVKATVSILLIYASSSGLAPDLAAGINTAVALGLVWFTRAAVVPSVKLSAETVQAAKATTQADINAGNVV